MMQEEIYMSLQPHPPIPQTNHIFRSKNITKFENVVDIFLGIVGEPELSDKNISCFERYIFKWNNKKSPDNRAQVLGGGGGGLRQVSAKSPSLIFFKPSPMNFAILLALNQLLHTQSSCFL